MENSNKRKCCSVPLCTNTSITTPQKIFIPVPTNIKRRKLWLRVAKRNPKDSANNPNIYFCEDHFDLKKDMVNYLQHGMGLSHKIEMVTGCIPTKFKCQMNRNVTQMPRNTQVPTTKKTLLDLKEEQKKQTEVTPTITYSSDDLKCTDNNSSDVQALKINAGMYEKMDDYRKVFASDIRRSEPIQTDSLYDLIKIVPTHPVAVKAQESAICDFSPVTDKYYTPKKRSKLKVRTVKSIRKEIEQDIYNYLPKALEKQKHLVLKKIMDGTAKSVNTKLMAKSMLKSDQPALRTSWQMLMNINPENHLHSKQFVLWNGKCIQVSGSKGGRSKFIYNFDLGKPRLQHYMATKTKMPNKKKGLLQSSLNVKFKPGPLKKKIHLDISHQKYHIGTTELVSLPKPGLDVQPVYGMTLESGSAKFVNSLREVNGTISEKWAEFAVTMLGSIEKSKAVQQNPDGIVTFDLNYKCDQHRILMRRDFIDVKDSMMVQDEKKKLPRYVSDDLNTALEIKDMMKKILDSIEISLEQENLYSGIDEARDTICDGPVNVNNHKDKLKRKYCELGKLDVTVIRLPENDRTDELSFCDKPFCSLGCVCASLECSNNIKTHCGLARCMFQCTCNFSRYQDANILKGGYSDFIPGLVNLDTEFYSKLAKEEQKFRQTVIVTGDNSILLKRQKRNWKVSKKYSEFYSNLNLKTKKKVEPMLSIVDLNLDCKDIEPWCMVHNLYKCFCKGRFTETSIYDYNEDNIKNTVTVEDLSITTKTHEIVHDILPSKELSINVKTNTINTYTPKISTMPDNPIYEEIYICARVQEYQGRKYSDGYYKNTNNKIKEMEQNDSKLKKRIMFILNRNEKNDKYIVKKHASLDSSAAVEVELKACESTPNLSPFEAEMPFSRPESKLELVPWLETSYKAYKQRISQGITKTSLEPPQMGKLCLYTWNFILQRYKQMKNLLIVSKKPPFRIFIGVDGKSSLFERCININHIELKDLHKFPVTVKHLLTSACDSLEDFCILYGWCNCWEIIGSVSKINEKCKTNKANDNVLTSKHLPSDKTLIKKMDLLNDKRKSSIDIQTNSKRHSISETSKWFVMTVEKDFSEIQFHTRGFFVTYNSIIKATNVARRTSKTVRLSSQKCADRGSGPQFGVYAIPDSKEYCVFVGPYEMHEPLGIETVKNTLYRRKDKKTRGVWITTDKLENGNVIDDPLSYISLPHMDKNDMIDLDNNDAMSGTNSDYTECSIDEINFLQDESYNEFCDIAKIHTKITKPIKIRKTQDFYHIASNGELKKVFFKTSRKQDIEESSSPTSTLITTSSALHLNISDTSDVLINSSSSDNVTEGESISGNFDDIDSDKGLHELISHDETVAHITPKITAVKSGNNIESKKTERGMFVLKPEEINKKILQKGLDEPESWNSLRNEPRRKINTNDMDIENFIAYSVVCESPDDDVFVVSDGSDDGDCNITEPEDTFTKVWIQCTNIENFGWIRGRKNLKNLLSFEFPGFKATDFYEVEDAFTKINQVLSRKVYIPKKFTLQWEIVESESHLKNKEMLKEEQLGPEFVLTKQGIRHKQELLNYKTSLPIKPSSTDFTISESTTPTCSFTTSKILGLSGLEKQSVNLENQCDALWNETLKNKTSILRSLSEASNETKQDLTEKLKTVISM